MYLNNDIGHDKYFVTPLPSKYIQSCALAALALLLLPVLDLPALLVVRRRSSCSSVLRADLGRILTCFEAEATDALPKIRASVIVENFMFLLWLYRLRE